MAWKTVARNRPFYALRKSSLWPSRSIGVGAEAVGSIFSISMKLTSSTVFAVVSSLSNPSLAGAELAVVLMAGRVVAALVNSSSSFLKVYPGRSGRRPREMSYSVPETRLFSMSSPWTTLYIKEVMRLRHGSMAGHTDR